MLPVEPARDAPSPHRLLAWIHLANFFLVSNVAEAEYVAHGEEPSRRFRLVCLLGLLTIGWYWLDQECRAARVRLPFDVGFFLAIAWFVVVPYYIVRAQRWKALLTGGFVALIYLFSAACGAAFAVLLA